MFKVILTEEVIRSPLTCLCKVCWGNLEQFNEFYSFVAANYQIEIREMKYQIPDEIKTTTADSTDMIVYDDGDKIENETIKVEIINENEQFDEAGHWLEEEIVSAPRTKTIRKISSIEPPKLSRQNTVLLDSADDQRIRETACMSCEVCNEALDSLRDAKAHFKVDLFHRLSKKCLLISLLSLLMG